MADLQQSAASEGDSLHFNENSFISSTQKESDSSITISYTPPSAHDLTEQPLMTPIQTRRFTANDSEGFIPMGDLDAEDDTPDKKLAGEVSGLLHMHNSRTSDTTTYGEGHRVDTTCVITGCASMSKNFLKCSECKLPVHYECSKLPSYQIFTFTNSQRKFTCENCVNLPSDWHPVPVDTAVPKVIPNPVSVDTAVPKDDSDDSKPCTTATMRNLFHDLERSLVNSVTKIQTENLALKEALMVKEKDTLNKEKAAIERQLGDARKSLSQCEKDKALMVKEKDTLNDTLNKEKAAIERQLGDARESLSQCEKDKAKLKEDYTSALQEVELLKENLNAAERILVSEKTSVSNADEKVEKDSDKCFDKLNDSDKPSDSSDSAKTLPANISDKFKCPDILLVTNSLGSEINPGQIFAPKFTHKVVLPHKSIEGAISFVNTCDIKPKQAVVFHVIENNIANGDKGDDVISKVNELKSAAKNAWAGIDIMFVEPIGRKFKDEQKTDNYVDVANSVRRNLSNVVPPNMIIKTADLHEVRFDTFVQDWVHLKPKGTSLLCKAYKDVVYKCLDITTNSIQSRFQKRKDGRGYQHQRFHGHRQETQYRRDDRRDGLSSLMRNFERGLRGFMNY